MRRNVGAEADGYHLLRDGDAWCAVGQDFVDLQQSPAGFGDTPDEAVGALRAALRKAGWPDHYLPRLGDFEVQGEWKREPPLAQAVRYAIQEAG
jgi:hypothetical protein